MTVFPGFKLRVGQRSGREQENSQRHDPCREHARGTRQVQDPQTDPVRKHQTAHRRVRMHVMPAFTDAKKKAHTAGPFCLDCSPASLKLFPLYPNKSDPQHDMVAQAQHNAQRWIWKTPFVIIPNFELRQVTGWKGTYCILLVHSSQGVYVAY